MRENRISVFRKHTLGILVALGMVLFGSVFILFTNIGKNKATVAARNVTVYKGTEQPVRGICRVLSGPSSGNERDHNDLQKWPCDRIKF